MVMPTNEHTSSATVPEWDREKKAAIGADAVVLRDVPANAVAVRIPARVILRSEREVS